MFAQILFAQAQGQPQGSGILGLLVPFLIMLPIFYFLMIRPQQQQQKKHREYLASLKKGDAVLTNAGIFGTVDAVEDLAVRLEIARDVKIRVLKGQIAGPQPGAAGGEAKKEST